MKAAAATLGLVVPPKRTCVISCQKIWFKILQAYYSINEGDVLRYINTVKSRHGMGLPKTCGYHHYGENRC